MENNVVKWAVVAVLAVLPAGAFGAAEISPALMNYLAHSERNEFVPVTIALDGGLAPAALESMTRGLDKNAARELVRSLARERTAASQEDLLAFLRAGEADGLVRDVQPLWAVNVIAADVRVPFLSRLVSFENVRRINLDAEYPVACGLAWGVDKVGAEKVWNTLSVNGKDVIVAVADTGVDYEHTDLENRDWVNTGEIPNNNIDDDGNGFIDDYNGWNFYSNDNQTRGGTGGHGSHCAGSVVGDGTAGTETGVAPGAFVMPVQVLSNGGSGTESTCWNGMQYAFDNGAHVTSMSLGWKQYWSPDRASWRSLCETLIAGGMVYAIAAGNERTDPGLPAPTNIRTPGDVPAVICVGATTQDDLYAYFSSYGPTTWSTISPWNDYPYPPGLTKPDVCAPGYIITSVRGIAGGYTTMSGTSMATPHVAGFAALILEVDSNLTNAEVRNWMENYALDLGDPGKDNDYGSGRIQCYETVSAMLATPVTLKSFTARAGEEGVRVRWTTANEKRLAGFNLYRRAVSENNTAGADVSARSFGKLNEGLIKGRSPYVYEDGAVELGTSYEYLLEDVDLLGKTHSHGPILVRAGGGTLPASYWLAQSAPNPARERAVIKFGLAEGFSGRAVLEIFDLSGRRVGTGFDRPCGEGAYEVEVDTTALAPGVYVYRLSAGSFAAARRMVVTR